MVQQQVVDYAKAQMKLGVARDTVRSTLLAAGWAEADIDDSLKSLDSLQQPAKAEEKKQQASSSIPTIIVSDLAAGAKAQPMASIKMDSLVKKAEPKIETLQAMTTKKPGESHTIMITMIVVVLVALAAAGGAAYLYMQNRALQVKVDGAASQIDAANAKAATLNSQVMELTSQKNVLDTKLAFSTAMNKGLSSELSFFVISPNSTSSELDFTLVGTISGGGKMLYAVTSNDGIKASVKNSKDAKVDAALKGLVGVVVEIGGTHAPGSKDVTVVSVNGTAL